MHRKIAARIVLVLLLCNLGFIWGNSWMSKDRSHAFSDTHLDVYKRQEENNIDVEAIAVEAVEGAADGSAE